MNAPDQELVIFPKRATLMTVAGITLGFLVISVLALAFAEALPLPRWEYIFFAYIGVPFFAFGLVYVVSWLVSRRPLLVISRAGIIENASLLRGGLIRWEDVADVFVYRFFGQRFMGIVLKDFDVLLARRSPVMRVLLKLNYGLLRAPISVGDKLLPMPVDTLVAEINRYRRA